MVYLCRKKQRSMALKIDKIKLNIEVKPNYEAFPINKNSQYFCLNGFQDPTKVLCVSNLSQKDRFFYRFSFFSSLRQPLQSPEQNLQRHQVLFRIS